MTPYEIDQLNQERCEQQDQAALERYADGSTDAGFGQLPQFADPDYLVGYVATIQRLPRDAQGKIIHSSPHQHFAFGLIDSPDPGYGEF